MRIRLLHSYLKACKNLEDAGEVVSKDYKSKMKARLSEMEMALEYWDYMQDAESEV
jgi:hypothetical protein